MMSARKAITVVAVVVFVASAVRAGSDDPVNIPDANLKQAVKDALGITTDPTEAEMATLHVLDAPRKDITNLTGIEYATSLGLLGLRENKISDISPLARLTTLWYLNLTADKSGNSNQIEDITPLAGLINLEVLRMHRNLVSDIGPLAGLTKLGRLELNSNQVSDIGPLAELTNLTELRLADNQISTIGPLAGLTKLKELYLGGKINNISPLAGLTSLIELGLGDNQISDISPLSGMTLLTNLYLSQNQISDISALSGMTQLTDLGLDRNQISDISALSGMTLLTELNLYDNQISDISPLSGMALLTKLRLPDNQISDISALSGMTLLTDLNLRDNQISDVSALSGMTLLTDLALHFNQINDISPLNGLVNLEELKLSHNQISDISPLQYMTHLTLLSLVGNPGNWEAYCIFGPIIVSNNPGINLSADPNPYDCDCPPAPTPKGSNIVVTPEDCTTGRSPVTLTFEEVTESGYTSLATSDSGPAPPTGFQLGDPPTYYDITTTASYSGLIAVCINYSGITFTGPPEALLLGYYEDPYWVDCTDFVDTENQLICGVVSSLSTFAIGEDVAPPTITSVSANPDTLWPPNHKMVEVTVDVEATDNGPTELFSYILGVTSNEPINGPGDGNTDPDWRYTDDPLTVLLRAERDGGADGRIYTIEVVCTDAAGNTSTATVEVMVPHDQGKGKNK